MAVAEAPPLAEVPPVADGSAAEATVEKPKGRRVKTVQMSLFPSAPVATSRVAITGFFEVTDAMLSTLLESGGEPVQLTVTAVARKVNHHLKRDAEGDPFVEQQVTVQVQEASKVRILVDDPS